MSADMLADMAEFLPLVTRGTEAADIDSVPFAHADQWVGDQTPEAPR